MGSVAKKPETTVIHGKISDGSEIVGIGNLRVVVIQEDEAWFAQGLEIDYAVQGESLEDAKAKFEHGLAATVNEHLNLYGGVKNLLKAAPPDVWSELALEPGTNKARRFRFSQVTLHELQLPYAGVDFLVPVSAGEVCAHV